MKYAIFNINGQQYKAEEGKEIEIDLQKEKKPEESISFEEVMLLVDDKNILVGTPNIKNAVIKAKVIENKKGKKIRVAKFKAKARYRRVNGFRPQFTKVKIESILSK